MLLFYLVVNSVYFLIILLPFFFYKDTNFFKEYFFIEEFTTELIAVLLLKTTLIFSIFYYFFIDKLANKINIRGLILNFFFSLMLFVFLFFSTYFFISQENLLILFKEYKNEFLLINIFLLMLFYLLFTFIVISSNYIYFKRNKKYIRKLANSEYEKEKLFKFILNYQEPMFDFYKYIRLLEFTNTYIVERKDQFLSTINFIRVNEFGILFDFYYEEEIDGNLLLEYLKANQIVSVKYLILDVKENIWKILNSFNNFVVISEEAQETLWDQFINESLEIKEYSLRDFFFLLTDFKNQLIFLNNTLQNKLIS